MTQDQYNNNEAASVYQFLIGTSIYHQFKNKIKSNVNTATYLSVMLILYPVYKNYNSTMSNQK